MPPNTPVGGLGAHGVNALGRKEFRGGGLADVDRAEPERASAAGAAHHGPLTE